MDCPHPLWTAGPRCTSEPSEANGFIVSGDSEQRDNLSPDRTFGLRQWIGGSKEFGRWLSPTPDNTPEGFYYFRHVYHADNMAQAVRVERTQHKKKYPNQEEEFTISLSVEDFEPFPEPGEHIAEDRGDGSAELDHLIVRATTGMRNAHTREAQDRAFARLTELCLREIRGVESRQKRHDLWDDLLLQVNSFQSARIKDVGTKRAKMDSFVIMEHLLEARRRDELETDEARNDATHKLIVVLEARLELAKESTSPSAGSSESRSLEH